MKGKNLLLLMLLALLAIGTTTAQDAAENNYSAKGLFLRANVGYGFEAIDVVQGTDETRDYRSNIYGSSAPGLTLGFGLGYMFNDYIGLELGATYTFGKDKFSEVVADPRPLGVQGAGSDFNLLTAYVFEQYTNRTTQLRIIPAVIIRGGTGRVVPYAKVGLVVPVAGKTATNVKGVLTSTEIPTSIAGFNIPGFGSGVSLVGEVDAYAESYGQFSTGFDATLGVDYSINSRISIFGEVNMVALNIKSKETRVRRYDGVYNLDGSPLSLEDLVNAINTISFGALDVDISSLGLYENISDVPTAEQHFIYVDEINAGNNNAEFGNSYNENLPQDQLARRENYSSLGINLGLKFTF